MRRKQVEKEIKKLGEEFNYYKAIADDEKNTSEKREEAFRLAMKITETRARLIYEYYHELF